MFEDASCSTPCGAEPMGCHNCTDATGRSFVVDNMPSVLHLVCTDCGEVFKVDLSKDDPACPGCGSYDLQEAK